uniref:VWFA domain-containing protein n=1 Tax=Arcella intermedia TaxID=1963864 RepID=A0A6B2KZ87_9EUKA|eukprot:TRINITY_DN8465_c0_g1_i1.p1 TRINITY_DN8465_c0_g1~~TRINITY_DN8465_c0_g1_i1.p1  ORF type:complete len:692 (-),score=128.36 TRINITY_DN8465_c0_g1_i1:15-2066(-)
MDFASKFFYVNETEENETFDDFTLNDEKDRKKVEKKKNRKAEKEEEEEEFLALSDDEDTYQYTNVPQNRLRQVRKADPNILAINLGTLAQDASNIFTGDPIFCSKCNAAVTQNSTLEPYEDAQLWACEYCGEKNKIFLDPEETPKSDTIDYIIASMNSNSNSNDIVVFCIDISGSMCCTSEVTGDIKIKLNEKLSKDLEQFIERQGGVSAQQYLPRERTDITYVSRLQCVQAAVSSQIESFAKDHPNKRVAIVTFNNDVTIYQPDGTRHVITGDHLKDFNYLSNVSQSLNLAFNSSVSQASQDLLSVVQTLEEGGGTALGPGLLCAVSIAALQRGSTVVLCTDGIANIGLGALDIPEEAAPFYRQVIDKCQAQGVAVSILGIQGTNTSMEQLALVAAETKGYNDIVDPLKLTKNFNFILQNSIISTDVSATMFLNRGLTFRGEKNAENSKAVRLIGNCTKETAITFEYFPVDQGTIKDLKHVHFQVQIHFTKLDGTKCLRVMSKMAEVTHDRLEAEKHVNVNVVGLHSHVQSAQLAAEGQYSKARMKQKANMRMVRRGLNTASATETQKSHYALWNKEATRFNSAIKQTKITEQKKGIRYDSAEEDASGSESGQEEKEKFDEEERERKELKKQRKQEKKAKLVQERKKNRYETDDVSNVLHQAQNPLYSTFTFAENPLYSDKK